MVVTVLTARVHDRMEELIFCLKHTYVSPANIYPILENVEAGMPVLTSGKTVSLRSKWI